MTEALDLGRMGVPVQNGIAAGKRLPEACSSSERGAGIVHQPDLDSSDLGDLPCWKPLPESDLVHIPAYCRHRCQPFELLEHRERHQVARVQNQIGIL